MSGIISISNPLNTSWCFIGVVVGKEEKKVKHYSKR